MLKYLENLEISRKYVQSVCFVLGTEIIVNINGVLFNHVFYLLFYTYIYFIKFII
jgi:hypothetical protein